MLNLFGSALLVAALASPAGAANWVRVASTRGGDVIEIDTKTMVFQRTRALAWEKITYGSPHKDGSTEARHYVLFDCDGGRAAVMQSMSLKNGILLETSIIPRSAAEARLSVPAPETVGEAELLAVCGGL